LDRNPTVKPVSRGFHVQHIPQRPDLSASFAVGTKLSIMQVRTTLTSAGNTLAPALASLKALGYEVSRDTSGQRLYRAENAVCSLSAEDPLLLLGLAKLYEVRGENWHPTDSEVSAFLGMEERDAK